MTYALLDNATLTAVERVFGKIEIKNPDTVNGDLVALENVIQAILFYDEVLCIDNYKTEFIDQRKKRFQFIRFVDPTKYKLNEIDDQAQSEAKHIRPEIRGGKFANDDFKEFFELLKMNIICTWDIRSSAYYLKMKMLGLPGTGDYAKYSKLSTSIFNELSDFGQSHGYWSTDVNLKGSDGTNHSTEIQKGTSRFSGTTKALDVFIASLNWLAYKSIYYSLAASYFRADTFLHPIRHAFQLNWMKRSGAYGSDFTSKLISSLTNDLGATYSDIIDNGRNSVIMQELPLFSAWLTVESGNVSDTIKSALELKESNDFITIRELLKEIRVSYDEQGISITNKKIENWKSELKKSSNYVKSKYGIKTDQGVPSTFLFNIYNSIAAVSSLPKFPSINFKIPLPDFMKTNRSKGFSNIYRNIVRDLTTFERLGSIYDMLASNFKFQKDWKNFYVNPETEDPKFVKYESWWKIPML